MIIQFEKSSQICALSKHALFSVLFIYAVFQEEIFPEVHTPIRSIPRTMSHGDFQTPAYQVGVSCIVEASSGCLNCISTEFHFILPHMPIPTPPVLPCHSCSIVHIFILPLFTFSLYRYVNRSVHLNAFEEIRIQRCSK